MNVYINGNKHCVKEGIFLDSLLAELSISTAEGGIAVAINDQIIPRSTWNRTLIEPEIRIEIVHAVAGG